MSQQKMHAVLLGLVVKTLTSGRLRTLFHLLFSWSVDPDLGVEGGWGWNLSHKSLGVVLIGIAQYLGSSFGDDLCVAFMDVSGRHESKADMVVFVLVPGEELRKEAPRLVDGRKSLGEVSSVLEGLELGFGEGIVASAHFAHFGHRIRSFRTVSDGEHSGSHRVPRLTPTSPPFW